MGESECIYIAAKMLGVSNDGVHQMSSTHSELYLRLDRVNDLCKLAGGELRSRQVIASIVDDWEISQREK